MCAAATTEDLSMYRTRIELSFDAGHRLPGYSGKCTAAHSHTFRAEVVVAAQELDPLGLTADFRELKATLNAWTDAHWTMPFCSATRTRN
jgi:6-pyruvoyltetrahydropterin/6-carboxytetrahydropterin synthase